MSRGQVLFFDVAWTVIFLYIWFIRGPVHAIVGVAAMKFVLRETYRMLTGYEPLDIVGYSFLFDEYTKHTINLVGFLIFEKFDAEKMKMNLFQKTEKLARLRHKLIDAWGFKWFKPLTKEEWDKCKPSYIRVMDGIHTKEQLSKLILDEQCIRMDWNQPIIQFILIPNYSETESAFVLKTHHVMMDGISIMQLFQALSDEYDPKNLINLRPMTIWHWVFTILLFPFHFLLISYYLLYGWKDNINAIRKWKAEKGVKKGAFTNQFDIAKIKAKSKEIKCTVNDLTTALLTMTMYEYFKKKVGSGKEPYWKMPDQIGVAIPFSFRQIAQKPEDIKFGNEISLLNTQFPLHATFEKALPSVQDKFNHAKNIMQPFGCQMFANIGAVLPFDAVFHLGNWATIKTTLIFSNINATKARFRYNGSLLLDMACYCPNVYTVSLGIALVSFGDLCVLSVDADIAEVENPQEIVDIFLDKYRQVVLNEGKKIAQ